MNKVELTDDNDWKIVINAMQGVIDSPEGTGHRFGHPPYTVAAKTGTAQVYSFSKRHYELDENNTEEKNLPEKLRDHSLIIAFAPVDKPQIAIAVIVENSKLASSVARQVLDYYLLPNVSKKLPPAENMAASVPLKKATTASPISTPEKKHVLS